MRTKLEPRTHATPHHPTAHESARTLWNHASTPSESVVVPTASATGHHIVLQGAHAADHASAASHIVNGCDAATSKRHCTSASDATLLLLPLSRTLLLTWRRLCGMLIETNDVAGDINGLAFW